jgi:hypothetical protein
LPWVYFAEDLRSVTQEGVDHVMRLFMRHCTTTPAINRPTHSNSKQKVDYLEQTEKLIDVLCDEEMLDTDKI